MNENDPNDHSFGYGGLPNQDGVVQLDASCMHGPTLQAGAVGALTGVKTSSLVAKAIMENTDEVFLPPTASNRASNLQPRLTSFEALCYQSKLGPA